MVLYLRSPLKPPLCFVDSLSEAYLGCQLRGPGQHPSHLCRDRRLAFLKGETWAEFNIRNCPFPSGERIDQLRGYESFKRSFDGRRACPSGGHRCIRILAGGKKNEKGSGAPLLYLPGLFNGWTDIDPLCPYF